MNIIRRYWIAGLVILLVTIHAIIVGYVRVEATKIQVASSNEIPLGVYYIQSADKQWLTQLRVHLIVQPEKRYAAKTAVEKNRWLLHEVVEEQLRQLDPSFFEDAVLLEIKEQIQLALSEQLQEDVIEQVVINDRLDLPIDTFRYQPPYNPTHPEQIFTATGFEDKPVVESAD
ncbi:MAG: hypothetical protein KatS3mg111_1505 [Pirellulaceae bacterium]|nr:MAG: hypothetical protein KatS3mg111_1505 [Pirellulaceae bacterium]